jgi:site-specific recombinase XerD
MEQVESIERFGEYLRRRYPDRRTAIDYVSDVRQFVGVCQKPWREVSLHDIDEFVDQQRAKCKGTTVRRRVAALKTFFEFLAEESGDLSWPNPVRFGRHAGKVGRPLPRDLSDQEVEKLWGAISSPRDRAWFALMLRAGLRVGEVAGLELGDVLSTAQDEQPARLRVCGKGRKERLVLLTADAYAILDAWLGVRPGRAETHLFLNERGQPLSTNGIEWLLRRYGQGVGIHLTPHQLRHTFARQLTEAGMPISSLGKLLGHAHVSTTQIYTAGADPELVEAYQSAMQRLAQKPPTVASSPVAASPPKPVVRSASAQPAPAMPKLEEWTEWMPHLPTALREATLAYIQRGLCTCKPRYQVAKARKGLGELGRFWTWQLSHRPITQLSDLQLQDLQSYQQERLLQGIGTATINRTLQYVLGLLHEEEERGQMVDGSVFRLRHLPRPQALPRHLSEEESQRLEAYVQKRLSSTDALMRLENACFFVLAHTGLRAQECVDLEGQDVDLQAGRLLVRQGKGQRDRVVYLSPTACQALRLYLEGILQGPQTPLWIRPDGQPIDYMWLYTHTGVLGQGAGVLQVTPHRLRHTLATRLLNVGMEVTRIQKLLGHEHLDTTMIYARVHDATVEADYRRAMSKIACRQPPLSDVPIMVADWPTTLPADSLYSPANHAAVLDNSV